MVDASIKWFPVSSSNVEAVGRCDDGHLYVRFKGSPPSVYRYDGAAKTHYDAMISAESVGRYVHRVIKPSLRGVRVS